MDLERCLYSRPAYLKKCCLSDPVTLKTKHTQTQNFKTKNQQSSKSRPCNKVWMKSVVITLDLVILKIKTNQAKPLKRKPDYLST